MKVLTCAETRAVEQRAVEHGVSMESLMEEAGRAVAGYLRESYDLEDASLLVLCGKGNNGGDGFVVARLLAHLCRSMTVLLVDGTPQTPLAQKKFAQLAGEDVTLVRYQGMTAELNTLLQQADVMVDAIYGIGFHGEVSEKLQPLFATVNATQVPLVAVDIPSGLSGDTPRLPPVYLQATDTVTFTTYKPVHLFSPTAEVCGKVHLAEVGIGRRVLLQQPSQLFTLEDSFVSAHLPQRDKTGNKGTFGRLLLVCGSMGMAGAAILAASAAVRSGVGLVEVALPKEIYPIVASNVTEPIYTLLDWSNPTMARQKVLERAALADACVIGCGLGRHRETDTLVKLLLAKCPVPLVLDADGINAVSEEPQRLTEAMPPLVLTPHPGELARLLHTTVAQLEENRLATVQHVQEQYDMTLVYKGHHTLVGQASGEAEEPLPQIAYNTTGKHGMAKGGSGDVLAGLLGGLLAQGISPFAAACLAVYLHGKAGEDCASHYSYHGMLPSHMVEALSHIFASYE